jgi:hypothetical protein
METIMLQFDSSLKEKIMTFLESLPSTAVEITMEDAYFENTKKKINASYERMKNGNEEFYDIDEADKILDKLISKYEN